MFEMYGGTEKKISRESSFASAEDGEDSSNSDSPDEEATHGIYHHITHGISTLIKSPKPSREPSRKTDSFVSDDEKELPKVAAGMEMLHSSGKSLRLFCRWQLYSLGPTRDE